MTMLAANMGSQKRIHTMRGLLVGGYKVGKSWTLSTGRPPVLVINPDQREAALAGKKDVYVLTPYDPPGLMSQPTIYSEILDVVGRIEHSRRLGDIHPNFKDDPKANEEIRTLGLDSVQSMSRAIIRYNMYSNPKELARSIKVGGQVLFFPSGWDTWNSDMECMEQLVARLVALSETAGIDFWVTFHETDENGKIDYFPGRHRQLVRYFSEVWRLTRAQQIPQAQVYPTYNFTAATTLNIPTGVVDNPNITTLVEQYGFTQTT